MPERNKTLEIKKKIIGLTRNREHVAALKLFHKYFSAANPADVEFINSFFVELNRLSLFEAGHRLLEDTAAWHPDDPEHQELKNNSCKLYVDSLVSQGNSQLLERENTSVRLEESLKRSDSLSREKMRIENDKMLHAITSKALAAFQTAFELQPHNMVVLTGLKRCYLLLDDHDKESEIEAFIEERKEEVRRRMALEEVEEEEPETEEVTIDEESVIVEDIKQLFENRQYEEVLKRVDYLHANYPINVPMMLTKARALAELRRFIEAEKALYKSEREDTHPFEVKDARLDIQEIKLKLLTKASNFYLSKAISLGTSIGADYFRQARKTLEKALTISPENIDLLDKYYTALKYLGDDEEAFKAKAMIYVIDPQFNISFDNAGKSSLCFIASFAFADYPLAIEDFRWFRREFVLSSKPGRSLNSWYVKNSPAAVVMLEKLPGAASISRLLLTVPLLFVRSLKTIKSFWR